MGAIESLLNLKRWSEDEAKQKFAFFLKELDAEEKRLLGLEEQYRQADRKFESASNELIDIAEIKRLNYYLEYVLGRIQRQQEVIELKELQVEEARKALLEASKEKKTFEKLDEKQKSAILKELKRKEQIGTDEHAGRRHARGKDHGTRQ